MGWVRTSATCVPAGIVTDDSWGGELAWLSVEDCSCAAQVQAKNRTVNVATIESLDLFVKGLGEKLRRKERHRIRHLVRKLLSGGFRGQRAEAGSRF